MIPRDAEIDESGLWTLEEVIAAHTGVPAVKPYYEDDSVTIYHGDSREIVPTLPRPELVVTDPPYGIQYASTKRMPHDG